MTQKNLIEDTINDLLTILEEDYKKFHVIYKSLPFEIYKKIERLAITKSIKNPDLHDNAKRLSNTFHKKFK